MQSERGKTDGLTVSVPCQLLLSRSFSQSVSQAPLIRDTYHIHICRRTTRCHLVIINSSISISISIASRRRLHLISQSSRRHTHTETACAHDASLSVVESESFSYQCQLTDLQLTRLSHQPLGPQTLRNCCT